MALVFATSFELGDGVKWETGEGVDSGNQGGGTPRTGTAALYIGINGRYGCQYTFRLPIVGPGFVVGAAVMSTYWQAPIDLLQLREDVWPWHVTHLSLGTVTDADGLRVRLCVKRGGGPSWYADDGEIIATGTQALRHACYYFVEMKGVIGASGSFEVRVNGIPEPGLSQSGVNTRHATGTGQWTRLGITGNGNSNLDDIYVCDQSGGVNTDFLGMPRIYVDGTNAPWMAGPPLEPLTDLVAPGTTRTLTPTGVLDHGENVNELSSFGSMDYNGSSALGAKDTYRFPSLPAGSPNIRALCTTMAARRSELHTVAGCHVVRTHGVDYDGPTIPFSNTFTSGSAQSAGWQMHQQVWDVNPNTGVAWTVAEVDAIEAGMKVTVAPLMTGPLNPSTLLFAPMVMGPLRSGLLNPSTFLFAPMVGQVITGELSPSTVSFVPTVVADHAVTTIPIASSTALFAPMVGEVITGELSSSTVVFSPTVT